MEKIIKRNSKKALYFYTRRATLIQTFKIEYQPSTGGTTEQEIIEAQMCIRDSPYYAGGADSFSNFEDD